jgi:thiamine pyrophosphate-dependent acetolactate synthase large subunit-like protein
VSLEAMLHPWTKPADLRPVAPSPKTQALPEDIAAVAALVRAARNPVIVTESPGRDPAAFKALIAFADRIGAPVIGGRASIYTNFPRNHPMWLGYQNFEHLEDADLILLIGGKAPWYPASKRPGTGKIVSISEYPLKHHLAYQVLHTDHYLEGDVARALNMLTEACACDDAARDARHARWTGVHDKYVASLDAAKAKALDAKGIDPVALAAVAGEMLPAGTIHVDETITHMPVMRPHLPLNTPQTFFRVTGGALGQGIGAALGAKLAARDKVVALFVGDGSFLYNPVIQALGASKTHELPILIVVCNNGRYEAMRKGHVLYYPGGAAETSKSHHGVHIEAPRYEDLGSHFGFFGASAETVDELRVAFRDALAALAAGKTAILNVSLVR